jgi:hypothetical protein
MRVVRAAALVLLALTAVARADAAGGPEITASVDRTSVGLGDPFHYTVDARGPAGLRLVADTGPFAAVAPPETQRDRSDGRDAVRLVQTLACLDRACAPDTGPRRVSLPRARIAGSGAATVGAAQSVTVVPRVPEAAVAARRADYRRETDLPLLSTPVSPGAAIALLGGAAALLAAIALVLVLLELGRRRRRRVPAGAAATGIGLARAVAFLRQSAGRPEPDRRRAADYAARAVGARRRLADEATRIAWRRPDPEPGDVEGLAARIERTTGEGR